MSYSETRGQLWGLLSSQDWRSSASALTESRGPRKYVERSSWCHREGIMHILDVEMAVQQVQPLRK